MGGHVEADETFIGGRARFMHKDKREKKVKGRGAFLSGKAAVMGLLERHGPDKQHSTVRVKVVENVKRNTLHPEIRANVKPGTTVYTDALKSYDKLDEYTHKVIDHAECYAKGNVHTNGMENFWSLLKRGIKGTYVSVEPFHLFRYLDEQAFRFNTRKGTDRSRFVEAVRNILGKRLTYKHLTGLDGAVATT